MERCKKAVKGSYKAHDMLNKKPQASFERKSPNPIDPASEKKWSSSVTQKGDNIQ